MILLGLGVIVFILSFILPERKQKLHEADRKLGEELLRELLEEQMKDVKVKVSEVVEEVITQATEKVERSMERIANEKIMAINEYSDTVLESIHKNNEEVVFLYDMLNDKHKNLKEIAAEVDKRIKAVRESVQESAREIEESAARTVQESAKTLEESAARAAQESVRAVEASAARATQESVRAVEASAARAAQESSKAVEESARAAWESAKAALQQVKDAEETRIRQKKDAERQAEKQVEKQTEKTAHPAIMVEEKREEKLKKEEKKPELSSFAPFSSLPVVESVPYDVIQKETEPVKEEKPKKKTAARKPAKPVPVNRETIPVPGELPEVKLSFANAGDDGKNNNEKILELHKAGKSNMAIARELGLGIGEVKLVIGLFKGV